MPFDEIAGQSETARRVRAPLRAERVPHAYLFVGSPGTGRARMARQLAQVILCADRPAPDEYCDRCEDCRLMRSGNHLDYHDVGVPEGRQQFPIGIIRDVVEPAAALKPSRGARKVFVLRDVDAMTLEAANCFLKTLEEPPGDSLFVLISAGRRLLPETIVSRCWVVRFPNLPPDDLRAALEAEQMPPAAAHWLARRSWGSPGLAAQYREAGLPEFNGELVEQLRRLSLADNFRLADWLDGQASNDARSATEARKALQRLLECVAVYYRDLTVAAAVPAQEPDLCNAALAEEVRSLVGDATPEEFLARAELVLETIEHVGGNANRQLALDHLFTQLGLRREART